MAAATASFHGTPQNNKSFDATASTPDSQSPLSSSPWQFPGPSSRFNQRERASTHSPANSTVTTPVAPTLRTEERAHRRAHSSYHRPASASASSHDQRDRFRKGLTHARSSHQTPTLTRFHSFGKPTTMTAAQGLRTPAKSAPPKPHDSPFSDYFTDDNKSVNDIASPALETQQLLVRLNKLQSTLMRSATDSQALYLVGRRMSQIENDMESLHSQSRQPPELADSGLFMEDAEEKDYPRHTYGTSLDGAIDEQPACQVGAEPEHVADNTGKAHKILASVMFAHQELQRRFDEVRNFREQHAKELRDKELELQALRTENQHMQQDLNLDHGDFVLLDGQLRLIQNQVLKVDPAPNGNVGLALDTMRADVRKAIEKVNSKRIRYSKCRTRPNGQHDEALKLGRWRMEVVRHPTGRVDTMLLERLAIHDDAEAPHFDIIETAAKVIDRQKTLLYIDQASQADLPLSTVVEESSDGSSDDEHDLRVELKRFATEEGFDSSDCAVTTSPSSDSVANDDDHTNGKAQTTTQSQPKSAWHELWHGMAELAGVGEQRW